MHNLVAQRQGQPVLFLCLLAVGWLLLRWVTWENPWPETGSGAEELLLAVEDVEGAAASATWNDEAVPNTETVFPGQTSKRNRGNVRDNRDTGRPRQATGVQAMPDGGLGSKTPTPQLSTVLGTSQRSISLRLVVPTENVSVRDEPVFQISRWRADGWLVLREGSSKLAEGGRLPASYGGSQAGVALAYRLAPASHYAPAAYFRTNRSFGSHGETDSALGLRIRPLQGVSIDVQVEARLTQRRDSTEIRPAALVAGGFEDAKLPMDLKARGYGQAGYVGGDFATAFADGALVAERETVTLGAGTLSIGAGAWGGAQKGASRVDVGPTVAVKFMAGEGPVRLEAGYRLRVAGNAAPENSGVLTLSTGF